MEKTEYEKGYEDGYHDGAKDCQIVRQNSGLCLQYVSGTGKEKRIQRTNG